MGSCLASKEYNLFLVYLVVKEALEKPGNICSLVASFEETYVEHDVRVARIKLDKLDVFKCLHGIIGVAKYNI